LKNDPSYCLRRITPLILRFIQIMEFPQDHYPPRKRVTHLALLAVLSTVNIFLVQRFAPELLAFQRTDFPSGDSNQFLGAVFHMLITYNMLGFILGSLLAMLPLSKWDYGKRYVKFSFLTMILIQLGILSYSLFKIFG
jgi:hypothetical protein